MPKKFIYRKQMGGLLDSHGFREQTETFLNGLDGDISAANAKIGNLNDLTTADKSSVVAAINEAAQSGGGGEEQFQKVYETTLTEGASQPIMIGSTDLGGAYIDAFVSVAFVEESALDGVRIVFSPTSDTPESSVSIDTVPTGDYGVCVSLLSVGGLMFSTLQDAENQNGAFKYEWGTYPDATFDEIVAISVLALSGGNIGTLPAGTTITVYARRKVTA